MAGWHHRLNGHGFGWTLGVGDGQGGLACCGSWGHKSWNMTELLNQTEMNMIPEVIKLMAPESTHDVGFKWERALSPTVLSL